jgi:hypothetical protein
MLVEPDKPKSRQQQQQNTEAQQRERSRASAMKDFTKTLDHQYPPIEGGIPERPSELLLDLVEFKDELHRIVASDTARNVPTRGIGTDEITAPQPRQCQPCLIDILQRPKIPAGEPKLLATPNPDAYTGSVCAALKVMLERPLNAIFTSAPAKHTVQFTIEDQPISVRGRDGQAFRPQRHGRHKVDRDVSHLRQGHTRPPP